MNDGSDQPGRLIPVDPELAKSTLHGEPWEDPVRTAELFLDALKLDPVHYRRALLRLTTAESHPQWGDFTAAAAFLRSLGDFGFGTTGQRPTLDTAYIAVIRDLDRDGYYVDGGPVVADAVVSLVYRADSQGWLVHGFGYPIEPEEMPRTDL